MAKLISFFNVSGRGWVTTDIEYCHACHQHTPKVIERGATIAEKVGIILPALEKDPNADRVVVHFEPEKWKALGLGWAPWEHGVGYFIENAPKAKGGTACD